LQWLDIPVQAEERFFESPYVAAGSEINNQIELIAARSVI
jgi:hypothetical protein